MYSCKGIGKIFDWMQDGTERTKSRMIADFGLNNQKYRIVIYYNTEDHVL